MSQKSVTKEEKYLIEALRLAEERRGLEEEVTDIAMDRYDIGLRARLNEKGVNAIVAQMIRGNLLRKRGEIEIALTHTGVEVASSLTAS